MGQLWISRLLIRQIENRVQFISLAFDEYRASFAVQPNVVYAMQMPQAIAKSKEKCSDMLDGRRMGMARMGVCVCIL